MKNSGAVDFALKFISQLTAQRHSYRRGALLNIKIKKL